MKYFYNKLTAFFDGDHKKARVVITLFAVGFFFIIVSNAFRFEMGAKMPILLKMFFKATIDLPWLYAAMLGAMHHRAKRNILLMPALFAYALGDMAVHIRIVLGGSFFALGHLLMIVAILNTTHIHKWQWVGFFAGIAVPVFTVINYGNRFGVDYRHRTLLKPVLILYGILIVSVMVFSMTSKYFCLSGFVFAVSDLAGFLRVTTTENRYLYILTTLIYFTAFFMLCISVFNTNRKEVVLWGDLFYLLKIARLLNIRIWVCGHWSKGLIQGRKSFSYDHLDIAYELKDLSSFRKLLYRGHYFKNDLSEQHNLYYSESLGELRIYPLTFVDGGSALIGMGSGTLTDLDSGFFHEIKVAGKSIPCIVPTDPDLLVQ